MIESTGPFTLPRGFDHEFPMEATRRRFLGASLGLGAAVTATCRGDVFPRADEPPSGADHQPEGHLGRPDRAGLEGDAHDLGSGRGKGDLVGCSEKVLQAAVDQVAARGGGTVRIVPGTYRLRNAVYLPSRVRLMGVGPESILIKEPSVTTKLAASSDWYDQEITLADARGFQVGDGVCLRARNPDTGGPVVIKRTLVARSGNRFKLDKALRENLWLEKGEPTAATLFPLLSAENVSDIVIENLALDGNRANNENLDGNYAGCIFAQDCSRLTVPRRDRPEQQRRRHLLAGLPRRPRRELPEPRPRGPGPAPRLGLAAADHAAQPGPPVPTSASSSAGASGSAWPSTTPSKTSAPRGSPSAIATPTTWSAHNTITRSGKVGVLFRDERKEFAAHRNRIEQNQILDSGPADGIGIDVQGQTECVTLCRQRDPRNPRPESRIGIRIGAKAKDVSLTENHIEGVSRRVSDSRRVVLIGLREQKINHSSRFRP